MRALVQRSGAASVTVDDRKVGAIDHGLVVLLGVKVGDSVEDANYLAEKVAHLRVFEDDSRKMNLDVLSVRGQVLSVSQFTLYGDVRKGRRPNFMQAAPPDTARALYEGFNNALRSYGLTVETGEFGAMMDVALVNNGPVTLFIDSERQI